MPNEQTGGKYSDNVMVKITSQVLDGVTKPPSNSFEKLLVEYDKMNKVKDSRDLTPREQQIYNKVQKTVDDHFNELFKKADPLLKELETHPHASSKRPRRQSGGGVDAGSQTPNPSVSTQTAGPDDSSMYLTRNRMFLWFKECLIGIWKFFKGLFGNALDKKLEEALAFFSVTNLLTMVNRGSAEGTGAAITEMNDKIKGPLEALQTTAIKGISGAATASVEMVMNAFSMIPGLGTTILVWRMFQNLLVIMGATLSSQAGANKVQNAFGEVVGEGTLVKAHGDAKGPDTGGGAKGGGRRGQSTHENITKKIKTRTIQLNRSMQTYMRLFTDNGKQRGGEGGLRGGKKTYLLPITQVSGYAAGNL